MAKQTVVGRSLDDLQSMAVFVEVLDARSFTAAARSLETTTSSVSKRVARLEERLGVRLLERSTRALAPTEAGVAFYERAARILRDVEEAEETVTQLGGAPRGTLRVSALTLLAEGGFGAILGAFAAEHPALRLDVDFTDRRVNLIEEGYDIAIRAMDLGAAPDSTLIARKLASVRTVVCAAPSYLARRGVPASIDDLAHHDCLHYTPAPLHKLWSFKTPEGVRSAPVTPRLQLNSIAALRAAAIAGCGLIRTSRLAVDAALEDGTLVPVLEEHTSVDFGLFAVHPAGKQDLPKVRAFIDFVTQHVGSCGA
jgi:DNA-binding transcriptional LysR family regulator